MKSRTSYFNLTAFRKDITRFAPVWVLYSVFLALYLTISCFSDEPKYRASGLLSGTEVFSFFMLGYGLICGQLLFGDLFNSRLCNALHAMPLRREGWFFTHVAAGLCFALVPNLVLVLLAMPMMGPYWVAAWWWFLIVSLEFVFFFGVACFSALCTGSRFAMTAVYAILNFLSMIVYWLILMLYIPRLTGVILSEEPFIWFCPMIQLFLRPIVDLELPEATFTLSSNLYNLLIYAAVGVALMGAALLLYRRRKLECAGDFLVFRPAAPVFLAVYPLLTGTLFYLFGMFVNAGTVFLVAGVVVGYFTGQMLLRRTVKVFQPKRLIGLVTILALLLGSIGLTSLDPLGVSRWVPQPGLVESVTIGDYRGYAGHTFTDPDSIAQTLEFNRQVVEGFGADEQSNDARHTVWLRYNMKGGAMLEREYVVYFDTPAAYALQPLIGSLEYLFDSDSNDPAALAEEVLYVLVSWDGKDVGLREDQILPLLEAIQTDCQSHIINPFFNSADYFCSLQFSMKGSSDTYLSISFNYPATVALLQSYGIGLE